MIFIFLIGLLLIPQAWGSESKRDIVMMVDNSGSMKKNDPDFLARLALQEFMSENDDDTRLALITFDQNVNLSIPFTPLTDASRPLLFEAIEKIDYSGLLTNSPAALERAIYEIALHGRDDADKSIIFITDGIVDTGNKTRDKQQEDWMLQELAVLASKLNIRIFGIAFAEAANYQLIQSLVSKTNGEHFRVLLADDLRGVFTRLEEIYRPVATPIIQENQQPKITLKTQLPSELDREAGDDDNNNLLAEPIKKDVTNETTATAEPLIEPERSVQYRADSTPEMFLNKVRRLYTNNEVIILSALFIFLTAFGALLILRKGAPRQLRSRLATDPSFGDDQLSALLIDINNVTPNRHHPLSKGITKIGRVNAGRYSNDIYHLLIDKPTIGREHALIEYKDGGYWLIDQDSTNGTFVNGKRVRNKIRLKDGNRVRFHDVEFIFSVPDLDSFEKTISVPIVNSRERAEDNENALLTKKSDNRHSIQTSSMAARNIRNTHFNSNNYKRSQDETRLKSVKDNLEYTKPFNKSGLRKQAIYDSSKDVATRSIPNQIGLKYKPETTPAAKSYSQTKGNTETLGTTTLPSMTAKGEPSEELMRSDTEEIQVVPCSELKKKSTDLIEPIREGSADPDMSQQPPISKTEEQAHESNKSDTEEISQDTFGLLFQSQQDGTLSKKRSKSLDPSRRLKKEAKEESSL
jgi:pSer/pThr/pTyr-binding forkhead associated (FHA) protein